MKAALSWLNHRDPTKSAFLKPQLDYNYTHNLCLSKTMSLALHAALHNLQVWFMRILQSIFTEFTRQQHQE